MGKQSPAASPGRQRWFRFCRFLTILILLSATGGIGFIIGLFASVAKVLPKGEALTNIRPPTPTRVLASDGSLLGRIYEPDQNRELVPLSRMGKIADATIDIEDFRFRSHPGIDLWGIARALQKNIITHSSREGASTITQQLARNLYLSREKKITRKLQEMVLALELERRYSKDEILETYLNQVYYGSNTHGLQSWGVQMAARNYFNKNAEDLTLPQAALLAGLPKNPAGYNPYRYPKEAIRRRNTVLDNMHRYGHISDEQFKDATSTPLQLAPEKPLLDIADSHAPYFVRYILNTEMEKIFGQDAKDLKYHYGVDIYTSLDPRMQKVAEETVIDQVKKNKFRHIDDGALISIDPQTGLIKAMVGGTDFRADQYNIITQGHRQPGSAFKPFDYSTAFLHGYDPDTIVFDKPQHFPNGTGRFWSPKNSDGKYLGAIPLKKALWLSRNCAAAGVAFDVGIKPIIANAHRMGIKYPLDPNLSTALGASVVVPLEICSAYGTLANHGVHNPPGGITRVTTGDGEVLYEYSPRPERALPTDIADTMKEMMRGVIERGTGMAARCPFPASGKTGTTNSFHDAWFIGYTDDLVTAVWVGNRGNEPMNHTFGATVPAPIWKTVMLVAEPIMAAEHKEVQAALNHANSLPELTDLDRTPTPLIARRLGKSAPDATQTATNAAHTAVATQTAAKPDEEYTVAICQETGLRATQWCPNQVMVTYVKGRPPEPPTQYCTKHTGPESVPLADGQVPSKSHGGKDTQGGILMAICAETGKIATDKCPTVLVRRFLHDAPTETCPLHGGE